MLLLFIIKISFMCIWLIAIRGTLPRYRLDSLSTRAWKEWALVWIFILSFNSCFILLLL